MSQFSRKITKPIKNSKPAKESITRIASRNPQTALESEANRISYSLVNDDRINTQSLIGNADSATAHEFHTTPEWDQRLTNKKTTVNPCQVRPVSISKIALVLTLAK